jgi:hypothetical protein
VTERATGIQSVLACLGAQAGRRATAGLAAAFWRRAAADDLLREHADRKLLAITTDVLICADTMVHLRRTHPAEPSRDR